MLLPEANTQGLKNRVLFRGMRHVPRGRSSSAGERGVAGESGVPPRSRYAELGPAAQAQLERRRLATAGTLTMGLAHTLNNAILPELLRVDTLARSLRYSTRVRAQLLGVRESLTALQSLANGLRVIAAASVARGAVRVRAWVCVSDPRHAEVARFVLAQHGGLECTPLRAAPHATGFPDVVICDPLSLPDVVICDPPSLPAIDTALARTPQSAGAARLIVIGRQPRDCKRRDICWIDPARLETLPHALRGEQGTQDVPSRAE